MTNAANGSTAAPASVPAARPLGGRVLAWFVPWTLALVAGFAIVFTLGAPLSTPADQRPGAYAPLPLPVTEASAVAAAERIVKLDYATYANATRSVKEGTSGGRQIWTVTYSRTNPAAGVRIIVSGATGEITVSTFP